MPEEARPAALRPAAEPEKGPLPSTGSDREQPHMIYGLGGVVPSRK